jgi:hypothetical protein
MLALFLREADVSDSATCDLWRPQRRQQQRASAVVRLAVMLTDVLIRSANSQSRAQGRRLELAGRATVALLSKSCGSARTSALIFSPF